MYFNYVRIISFDYWNKLKIAFERRENKSRKNLPEALSKYLSSILWMTVCWFELGALEAQEFIARMTSCLFLLSKQWENFIFEILTSDWSICEGFFPYLFRFHLIAINKSREFSLNKPLNICLFLLLYIYDAISSGCFFVKFLRQKKGLFPRKSKALA